MRALVIAAVALCACDARVGGTVNNVGDDVDGGTGDGGSTDTTPACFNGRRIFLQFEGQVLQQGTPSDATLNRASWMQITTGTAPPFKAGVANRMAQIQQIVDGVNAELAGFPIVVEKTRPVKGPYMMIVIGGTAGQVGSRFGIGVQELDCGDINKSDVAWITDTTSNQRIINTVMGAIGFGIGLTATLDPKDCMCGWDNNCSPDNTTSCRLTTPTIDRDPNARQRCTGVTTQDEIGAINTAFCQ
jgi:hypothetical protein